MLPQSTKNKKNVEDVIESIIKDPIPNNDYWWEEDIFSKTDTQPTIDATKIIVDDIKQTTNNALKDIDIQAISDNILRNLRPFDNRNTQQLIDEDFISVDNRTQQELDDDDYFSLESDNENPDVFTIEDVSDNEIDTLAAAVPKPPPIPLEKINEISDNILRNIRPVDNRTKQELIDDQFIPLDDRTYQQLQDDDYLSLESDNNDIIEIDTTSAWDQNKTEIAKPGPIIKLSTDYDRKVKAAKKIKNKYFKKKIGQINTKNKASKDWLKAAGYLDTKDQDKINYIFVPPKKVEINKIPGDAALFIRTEIDSTDFKKENLATKIRRNKSIRKPYKKNA